MADLLTVAPGGRLELHFHPGQWRAWESLARWVVVLAGTQSGKTTFGPLWLWREIQLRGAGDYMVVTPTFTLLELKALPAFRYVFETLLRLGHYVASPIRKFVFSADGARRTFGAVPDEPTVVYFGYAADPESLESATIKGLWADEAGQKKFKLGAYEALQRRCAIHEARQLYTTTPYDLGWLKQQLYDAAKAGDKTIDIINFASIMNPAFPKAEYDRMKSKMPDWKFGMFYDGRFERPAGLIYDCFDLDYHKIPWFAIPADWPRYMGLDFGGVHTAAVFIAEEPGTPNLYAYREYLQGGKTAEGHARALIQGEPGLPAAAVGGSKSEGQWRREFAAGGLPIRPPPISEVEVGIDRVYSLIKGKRLRVLDTCTGLLDELATYARVLDAHGEPTPEIEDKETYHRLDALRYIGTRLVHGGISAR